MSDQGASSSTGPSNGESSIAEQSSSTQQQQQQQPQLPSQPKECASCKKPETSSDPDAPILKPCISCKSVLYCSRDCKKADLKKHKKVCASLAQEHSKTADIKMASRAPPKADSHRGGLQKWQFDT